MPSILTTQKPSEVRPHWSSTDLATLNNIILKSEKKGLGMGYIVLLHPGTEGTCCVLCGKYFHMNLIMNHISSNRHGLAYCELNFQDLYETRLKKLYLMKFHELIEEHLDTLSKCIHSLYPIPHPSFIEPECYDKNIDNIYQKIMNAPHISQQYLETFNCNVMNVILQQTKKIEDIQNENVSNKDQVKYAKLKLSAAMFDAITSESQDTERTFMHTKINFALLMMNMNSDLKSECNLDAKEIENILDSALKLEAVFSNSSNTLLRNSRNLNFIIAEMKKIQASTFERGLLHNLKELTLTMMRKLIETSENVNQTLSVKSQGVQENNNEIEIIQQDQPSDENLDNDQAQSNIPDALPDQTENDPENFAQNYPEQQAPGNDMANTPIQPSVVILVQQVYPYELYYQLPVLYLDNSRADLCQIHQRMDIYSDIPLPIVFWTPAYNYKTDAWHWFYAHRRED